MKLFSVLLIGVLTAHLPIAVGQSISAPATDARQTQTRGYWVDPATGLMWAARDSAKDLSWRGAVKYCEKLRLARFSDWRLANMAELQGIFDRAAEAPGLAGMHSTDATTRHVKGNLFLTAYEWSNNFPLNERKRKSGYMYCFDFNEGRSNDDPIGWPYPYAFRRALCVRGSGDPLGGERKP